MDFLRRRLRGSAAPGAAPADPETAESENATEAGEAQASPVDDEARERDYELDLLRQEQDRLDDLQQRQLRYADYAWEPPAQGGERRADDEDRSGTT